MRPRLASWSVCGNGNAEIRVGFWNSRSLGGVSTHSFDCRIGQCPACFPKIIGLYFLYNEARLYVCSFRNLPFLPFRQHCVRFRRRTSNAGEICFHPDYAALATLNVEPAKLEPESPTRFIANYGIWEIELSNDMPSIDTREPRLWHMQLGVNVRTNCRKVINHQLDKLVVLRPSVCLVPCMYSTVLYYVGT